MLKKVFKNKNYDKYYYTVLVLRIFYTFFDQKKKERHLIFPFVIISDGNRFL